MKTTTLQIVSLLVLYFLSLNVNAQIAINTTGALPVASSMLDITSTTSGLLIPRMTQAQKTAIAAPATGLLVYQTNGTAGYWYWNGTIWVRLYSGTGNAWDILGNAGTVAGTNFIGTTDAQALDFRTNNTLRFRVANANQVHAMSLGTTLLPFYSFSADPNTGLWSSAADRLNFSTNAVERLELGTTEAVFNDISANYDFRVESDGSANMFFIDASTDRIGIGINNPAYDLEMKTDVAGDYIASFENSNSTGSSLMGYKGVGDFNALGGATNVATGLGIYGVSLQATGASTAVWGTSNSSDAFGVYGSIPTTGSWFGYGGIFTGGLGYVNGLYNLSDERVKTNIKPISKAIDKLKQIKGVSYTYNLKEFNYLVRGDTKTYLGFLAQDIEKVFPEAVAKKQLVVEGPNEMSSTADMSKFKREIFNVVDYTALVPVLVEAIKEQQIIIEEQSANIEALEKIVLELQKAIENK